MANPVAASSGAAAPPYNYKSVLQAMVQRGVETSVFLLGSVADVRGERG